MIAASRKAIVAGVVAFLGPVVVLLSETAATGPIELRAWLLAIASGIIAAALTYVVPNAPAPPPE